MVLTAPELVVNDTYGRSHRATLPEYNVALALETLELPFMFQVEFFGGRRIRGGQVLDFLVYAPFEIPLQVYGEYWHEGMLAADDQLKLNLIKQSTRADVEIIWGKDAATPEDALSACRSIFG